MKHVYLSQRVSIVDSYCERRDALDQRWANFLEMAGAIGWPMPNNPDVVTKMLSERPPDAIVLTGGNSLVADGGNAPERDKTDQLLLKWAIANGIPVVGVCRGMQSIIHYFGGILSAVTGHVGCYHEITGIFKRRVNSYHTLASKQLPPQLRAVATATDGVVEAIAHQTMPITGIMWHPEREDIFERNDIDFFINILEGNTP